MSFDKINISYLFNEKGLYLLLTIGVFLLLYLFLILVKRKIKKTKLYEIIFINAFLDSIDG